MTRELYDATADMDPDEARALIARAEADDAEQVWQTGSHERWDVPMLVDDCPVPTWGWLFAVAALLGAAAGIYAAMWWA